MCNALLVIFLLLVFNVADDTSDFLFHQHLCHACLQNIRKTLSLPRRHKSSTKLLWKHKNFTFSTVGKLITSLVREVSLYPVGTCRDVHTRASVIFTKILMLMNDRIPKQIQIFQICVDNRLSSVHFSSKGF